MAQTSTEHNPFMLLVNPQAVIAAVEKSERLERLNRHLCRPLDRPAPAQASRPAADDADGADPMDVVEDGDPIGGQPI